MYKCRYCGTLCKWRHLLGLLLLNPVNLQSIVLVCFTSQKCLPLCIQTFPLVCVSYIFLMINATLFGDLHIRGVLVLTEKCVKNSSEAKSLALVFIKWQILDWFWITVTVYPKFSMIFKVISMEFFYSQISEHLFISFKICIYCWLSASLRSNIAFISIKKSCNISSGSEVINLTALNI